MALLTELSPEASIHLLSVDGAVNVDCVGREGIPNKIVCRRQAAVFPEHPQRFSRRTCRAGGQSEAILDFVRGIVDGADVMAGRNGVFPGWDAQESGGDAALQGGIESEGRIGKIVFLGPPKALALEERLPGANLAHHLLQGLP